VTSIDPAAATAAYLAAMPRDEVAKSIAFTHGAELIEVGGWVVTLIVAWILVRTGLFTRLRDALEKSRPRPLLTSFLAAVIFFLAL
jgi:STE24 endopeptidase